MCLIQSQLSQPPLKAVHSSRKWKGGLNPEGLQEQILPCNLPSRFRSKQTATAHRLLTVEGLALNLATAAEVQFNLLRLIMATLFTSAPGEETASFFCQKVSPQDVRQHIIRRMLEANQAVVDNTSTLLGNTIFWRRDGVIHN